MGLGVFPCFNPRVSAAEFDSDGKILLREFENLDEISQELGLTPFSAFGDNRQVPEDFDGDPDELDEILGDWDEWFSIDNGLKTIDGLFAAIKADSSFAERLEYPDDICSELEQMAKCLRIAQASNAQFRFEVS